MVRPRSTVQSPVERAFTTFEVAKICGVFHTTVINWVNKGKLKAHVTPGGHRRIRLSHLLEFMRKFEFPIPPNLSQRSKKVLVVDDDDSCMRLLVDALGDLPDADIQSCDDGLAALIAIGKEPPDLLVLDIRIPGVDGFNVCRLLKSNEQTQQIKIVAVSGKDLTKAEREFLKSNTDGFFAKPLPLAELVSKASELMELGSTETVG